MYDKEIINQLRDIRGLDIQPYWMDYLNEFIILAIVLIIVLVLYYSKRFHNEFSWKQDAKKRLLTLRKKLHSGEKARIVLADFTELLRQIAIARYGRRSCAGLWGNDWLHWLQLHDPGRFQWLDKGRQLVSSSYAPPDEVIDTDLLKQMLNAAMRWVETDR